MPHYRIHRMKEAQRELFRWTAHTGGMAVVKPKDYEPGEEAEGSTPYAVWKLLLAQGQALHPGDLLELLNTDASPGALHIAKYIGFETAQWVVPEPKPESGVETAALGNSTPELPQLNHSS